MSSGLAPEGRAGMSVATAFLLLVVASAGLIDVPRNIQLGPVTLLGIISGVAVAGPVLFLLAEPRWPVSLVKPAAWTWVIAGWAALTLLISGANPAGLQNVTIFFLIGLVCLLASVQGYRDPRFSRRVLVALRVAALLGSLLYIPTVLLAELDPARGPRSYGLVAMLGVAGEASGWDRSRLRSFVITAVLTCIVLASLSRTAFILCLLIIWLGQLRPGSVRSRLRFFLVGSLATASLILLVTRYPPLRERFAVGDLSLRVGTLAVNVEGRSRMWAATYDDLRQSPWIGRGAGSAGALMRVLFGIDHPHNEYLRLAHDYGILGLAAFLLSLGQLGFGARRSWVACSRSEARVGQGEASHIHRTAYLVVIGVTLSMITDNSISYYVVTAPLAALAGASIGRRVAEGPVHKPTGRAYLRDRVHSSVRR